jgi:hypothetical protein
VSAEEVKEARQQEQENRLHAQNFSQPTKQDKSSNTAEILRYLSQIDDLPIGSEDPVMGTLVSKLTSTANLTPEQVRSNEWWFEVLLVLYLCKFPRPDGMHGSDRAWAHGDADEYRRPMKPERRMQIEAHVSGAKLGLTRSEDMAGVKESVRTVKESIVNDDNQGSSSGGILGRLGVK